MLECNPNWNCRGRPIFKKKLFKFLHDVALRKQIKLNHLRNHLHQFEKTYSDHVLFFFILNFVALLYSLCAELTGANKLNSLSVCVFIGEVEPCVHCYK